MEEPKNKRGFQKFLNWIVYGCLLAVAYIMIQTWWNSPSPDKSTNSPSVAHEQPKYQSFDFKVEGANNYSNSDHYIGTVTDDRVHLKLDYINEGIRKVTILDFSPRTGKGTWSTTYPNTATLLHGARTDEGSLRADRTSDRFPIFQLTLDYRGKTIGYGALVPVSTGS